MVMNLCMGGFKAYFTATYPAGTTTLKCHHEDGTTVLTASGLSSSGGTYAFELPKKGKWHLSATKSSTSQSTTGTAKSVTTNRQQVSDTIAFEDIGIGGTINVTAPANITVQVIKGTDQSTVQRKSSGSTGQVSFAIHDGGVWTVSAASCESVEVKISTQGQSVTARLRIPVEVTITGQQYSGTFDNQSHTVNSWSITKKSNSQYANSNVICSRTSAQLSVSRTAAGKTEMPIEASMFSNSNDDYRVTFIVIKGYVNISPLSVAVTITGNQSTVVYDGASHSVSGYSVSFNNNLFNASYVALNSTGQQHSMSITQTAAGDYSVGLQASWFYCTSGNFSVTFTIAKDIKLSITTTRLTVRITGNVNSSDYTGSAITASGYTWKAYYYGTNNVCSDYKENMMTFTGTRSVSITNVKSGETSSSVNAGLSASQFSNNSNGIKFTVTFVIDRDITATVKAKPIIVKADNKSKDYGAANPTFTASVYYGSQTLASGVTNYAGFNFTFSLSGSTITPSVSGTNPNYSVTTQTGTLTEASDPNGYIRATRYGYVNVYAEDSLGNGYTADPQMSTVTVTVPPGSYSVLVTYGPIGAGQTQWTSATVAAGQTVDV